MSLPIDTSRDVYVWTLKQTKHPTHNKLIPTDGDKETKVRLSSEGNHMCVRECAHAYGSTKPGSKKEEREMPSEPEAWEPRPHIILEEMHRQQRGTRCNTLMNKYAEGWNWSLVLSGGDKKRKKETSMNRAPAIWWVVLKHVMILERCFLLLVMVLFGFCLCNLITVFFCSM